MKNLSKLARIVIMAVFFLASLTGLSIILEAGASVLEATGFIAIMGLVTYGTSVMISVFNTKSLTV